MANSKTMILVRPRGAHWYRGGQFYSNPTRSTYPWASLIKEQFETQGWRVCDLGENLAVTTQVESTLQSVDSTVFVFYGHGSEDGMEGQNGEPLIHLGNVNLLKDKIVYVVACWTAKVLGKQAEHFVRCYCGYDDEIILRLDKFYLEKLGECVNAGLFVMLEGSTSEQARQRIVAEYEHWIDYFSIGDGNVDKRSVEFAADLRHNRDALRLLGNTTAKFW